MFDIKNKFSCCDRVQIPRLSVVSIVSVVTQPADMNIFLTKNANAAVSSDLHPVAIPPPSGEETSELEFPTEFPQGFEPLRSEQLAEMRLQSSPVVKDPFCSPLLAPDNMLKGLPPVHIVVRRWRQLESLQSESRELVLIKEPRN